MLKGFHRGCGALWNMWTSAIVATVFTAAYHDDSCDYCKLPKILHSISSIPEASSFGIAGLIPGLSASISSKSSRVLVW